MALVQANGNFVADSHLAGQKKNNGFKWGYVQVTAAQFWYLTEMHVAIVGHAHIALVESFFGVWIVQDWVNLRG